MIFATEKSCRNVNEKHRNYLQILTKQFSTLTSSYTQAINKQEKRYGSLWNHATKAKKLSGNIYIGDDGIPKKDILYTCFNYIHQNPVNAKLVDKLEDWEYSSFQDYIKKRNGKLANKSLAFEIIRLDRENIYEQSYIELNERILKLIF